MADLSRAHRVPFIDTTRILANDPVWARDVMAGDGAHPGSDGYRRLAELLLAGGWRDWIASPVGEPADSSECDW
jgi:acyl-CoA thioesterase-1